MYGNQSCIFSVFPGFFPYTLGNYIFFPHQKCLLSGVVVVVVVVVGGGGTIPKPQNLDFST